MLEATLKITGVATHDLTDAIDEAQRLIGEEFTSGHDEHERASFRFEIDPGPDTVYLVRPADVVEPVAVFADQADAERFAATFGDVGGVEAAVVVSGSALVDRMIRDRVDELDPDDENGLSTGAPSIGTRGMTSNMQMGTVVSEPDFDGWFRVALDTGGVEMLNAERFSIQHVFGDPTRPLPTTDRDEIDAAVDAFYEKAQALKVGATVYAQDGRRGVVVARGATLWIDRDVKHPCVRFDGKLEAVEVSYEHLSRSAPAVRQVPPATPSQAPD